MTRPPAAFEPATVTAAATRAGSERYAIDIVTCEYPPMIGGLADYTTNVAEALEQKGYLTRIWAPGRVGNSEVRAQDGVIRSFGRFGLRDLLLNERLMGSAKGRCLILQWEPVGYGWRSLNLPFCLWIGTRALRGTRLVITFHETFLTFNKRSLRRYSAAIVQRAMAFALLSGATAAIASSESGAGSLRRLCFRPAKIQHVPVFSNIGTRGAAVEQVASVRQKLIRANEVLVGHFGRYMVNTIPLVLPPLEALLRRDPMAKILFIGECGEQYRSALLARHPGWGDRIVASGVCTLEEIAGLIAACDLVFQPYPGGITTKRGSAMAALAQARCVVSNKGDETEGLWSDCAGLRMIEALDPELIATELSRLATSRVELAERGVAALAFYRNHFSLERTIDAILSVIGHSEAPPGESRPELLTTNRQAAEQNIEDLEREITEPQDVLPAEVAKGLVSGTSTLGMGVLIERSCGFLANILAARFGGAQTFGTYSLAISTANNVSAYAAGGIGSTAIRFSAQHGIGSAGYTALARALAVVAAVSAMLAACTLWLGATPLSHLLNKPALTSVLRWAGCSAAAIIILECCRGFFVGQRRLKALLCLSGFAGTGLLTMLPIASFSGPRAMLIAQSSVAMGAVFMCLLFYRSLGLVSQVQPEHTLPVGSLLRRIWSFSLMQIAGIVSMNIGGWWLTTLIAKGDTTMKQVGYFAVAHQLRNMVALMPSLIIEGSFAEMTESADGRQRSPDQVTAICTYVATLVTVVLAGFGMIVVPWVLPLIYGRAYASASPAAAIALATAVIHMGSGAAAFRVSVLSIRTSIVVNTTWALVVGGAATLFLLRGGGAATGAAVYLGAHVVTSILVLGFLRRRGNAPRGMISAFSIGALCIIALAGLSLLRSSTGPARFAVPAVMAVIWAAGAATLIGIGKRRRWLPTKSIIMRMRDKVFGALRPKLS